MLIKRRPTFLQRVKSAWAILTGRSWLYLGINDLEARWLCEPVEGSLLRLTLEVRLNKRTYQSRKQILCGTHNPEERQDRIDGAMKHMVNEIMQHVLVGDKK